MFGAARRPSGAGRPEHGHEVAVDTTAMRSDAAPTNGSEPQRADGSGESIVLQNFESAPFLLGTYHGARGHSGTHASGRPPTSDKARNYLRRNRISVFCNRRSHKPIAEAAMSGDASNFKSSTIVCVEQFL